MPLDHYVTLGRSGLRVSPLCLGAMTFGEDLGWGSSVEESQQIINRYIELGGNFIDTANFYTRSHSEKIIGEHVGRYPGRRDRLTREGERPLCGRSRLSDRDAGLPARHGRSPRPGQQSAKDCICGRHLQHRQQ